MEDNECAQSLSILLVDARANSRLSLEQKLREACGHLMVSATNGKDALALARKVLAQVAIHDWQ